MDYIEFDTKIPFIKKKAHAVTKKEFTENKTPTLCRFYTEILG